MKELFVKRNLVGYVIKIIGLTIIGWGFIQGLFVAVQFSQHNTIGMDEWGMMSQSGGSGFVSFLAVVFTSAIYGVLVIGFGEVIDLLQKIFDQNNPTTTIKPKLRAKSYVPFSSGQELREFYSEMNMEIESIAPTKGRDVFRVKVDGRTEYIDLRGHSPRLLTEEEAEKYM